MMTLGPLQWSGNGNSTWATEAATHAQTVTKNLVRSDGSTYQLSDFNPATGAPASPQYYPTGGLSATSVWARGQAWALYGFVQAYQTSGNPAFLMTADHDMHHKSRCWDIEKACQARGLKLRAAISAEQDKYLKHHRGFGGTAWVYLNKPDDRYKVIAALSSIPGVESVMTREEAASRYSLYASRIGDICVFGDRDTVFGDLDRNSEDLPESYRSHGSTSELNIPLFAYNAKGLPADSYFEHNVDLTRWLYRG